ncbi:hypothetical protein PVT68_15355 [Microbulbifer bruguierae]|uniref:Solute-binding protein family 3/N-terminal domain-containing protein n=1 Tax=Microbulbifer bruguierae TaxID=3029061 RepID=A0ABY8NC21_9GAMM|nr:hypothetical protein [Microbulbifer bruguierae]WGL16137.1 hypothetical protein PVT68_15355 [Microbulbifer bruguierae]
MIPLIFSSRKAYWSTLGLLVAAGVALCLWNSGQRTVLPQLGDYHLYRCETGAAKAPVFSLHLISFVLAQQMAERLCTTREIQQYYGAVQVSWKPRGFLNAEEILSENYDLIWSRASSMTGLLPEYTEFYEPLLRYDHYRVYWFSRGAVPELTAEYFHGKRIGLLKDKLSHTLYLLPLASLKAAGIEFATENLVYFDDAVKLYQAFARGELDLVSGGDYVEQELDIPLSRTLISDDVIAATLFVRKSRPRTADCAIARVFDEFTEDNQQWRRAFQGSGDCGN